jgi:tellurite resistance protein
MTSKNIITDEMLAAVIDGVATPEERRLVYKVIEGDEELREAFNHCMYGKVFEEEIERDFNARYADVVIELAPVVETQSNIGHSTILNMINLSGNYTNSIEKE